MKATCDMLGGLFLIACIALVFWLGGPCWGAAYVALQLLGSFLLAVAKRIR